MTFNSRIIRIDNLDDAREELEKLNCDPAGVSIMMDKAVFKAVKLEQVTARAANLLKQTFLAKGGEAAVARSTANRNADYSDVLICATMKQYRLALAQLTQQPWGLPELAAELGRVLDLVAERSERVYTRGGRSLTVGPGKTLVMGILNITPDSFSDGGKYMTMDDALRHAEAMAADGADILDVGAESTRPYSDAQPVSAAEEMQRLLPLLEKLLATVPLPVSVDTYKAVVAEEALKSGAQMLNDVWGLQRDPDMVKVAARYGVPIVVMHNQQEAGYPRGVMSHVCEFLRHSLHIAVQQGVDPDNLIVDPGIGFAKTPADNLTIMARLEELQSLHCPILLGTSRKRFIGEALGLPVDDRVEGTAATVALGIMKGARIVRVHDVKAIARVAKMTDAMLQAR